MMMTDGFVWGNDNKLCVRRDSNLLIYWPASERERKRDAQPLNASDKDIRNGEGRAVLIG